MKGNETHVQQYLESLQSKGRYYFIRNEVISALKLSDNAYKKAINRLIAKGKVARIRGDFFIIITPENKAIGCLPATWFIEALMGYLNQPYYAGLLTAAALHGAAHQQPMVFQVITNKPTRAIEVGKVRIEFLCKKIIKPYYYQQVKTVTGMMNVSTPEMTAFDLVRYINAAGQINHVATVLIELIERVQARMLVKFIKSGDVEVTIAQRLGYLLDKLSLPINLRPFEQALKEKKCLKRLLIAGISQPVLEYSPRWHILVNEEVEPDDL